MPVESLYTFECEICEKRFTNSSKGAAEKAAQECERGHDMLYIQLERSELQRLLAFMVSGNYDYIPEGLYEKLNKYRSLL